MALRRSRIAKVLVALALCLLLISAIGCSSDEASKPEATPASEADGGGDEHNVAPGNAAQDAVDELNEKIEDSTSDP